MADVVLGIGSSHGPLLSTPPEQWDLRAKADRENKNHWFRGKTYDYPALLQERAPGFAQEIGLEKRHERFVQCRSALTEQVVIYQRSPTLLIRASSTPYSWSEAAGSIARS